MTLSGTSWSRMTTTSTATSRTQRRHLNVVDDNADDNGTDDNDDRNGNVNDDVARDDIAVLGDIAVVVGDVVLEDDVVGVVAVEDVGGKHDADEGRRCYQRRGRRPPGRQRCGKTWKGR